MKRLKLLSLSLVLSFVFFFFSIHSSQAATLYWVGNDGANASVASNWKTTNPATCGSGDASAIPGSADTMNFDADCDNGAVIDSGFSTSVANLTMSSGYAGTVTLSNPLTITNAFSQVAGTFTATSQTFDIDGTYSLTGGTFTASSTNTYVGSTFTVSGTPTFNHNSGTFIFDTSAATLTCVSSSLPAFNVVNLSQPAANNKVISSGCSFPLGANPTIGGRISLSGTLSGSGTVTANANGTDGFNAGATLTGFTGWTDTGTFTVSGATLDFGSFTTATFAGWTMSSGAFTAPTGTMSISGNFSISGGTFTHNSGTVTFNGSGQTLNCNGATFNAVNLTIGSKTIGGTSSCSLPLGNNPTIPTTVSLSSVSAVTLSGSGTLTFSAGTFTLSHASDSLSGFSGLVVSALTLNTGGPTLNLSSYSTFVAAGTVTLSAGSLTLPNGADLNGALTISGGTFTAPSGTMTLAGSLTISGTPTFNANGGTITFDGAAGTLACNNVTFSRVNLSGTSSTKTINSDCTLPIGSNPNAGVAINLSGTLVGTGRLLMTAGFTFNSGASLSGFTELSVGNLTLASGTLDLSSYNTVRVTSTNFILTSGTFIAPPTLYFSGSSFTNSSGATFTHNNGTVIFDRSVATGQTTFSGNTTFYNFVRTTTVPYTLTFTAGTTQTIQGNLTLSGTSAAKVSLRSSTSGLQYYFNATGGRVLSNLNVQDSNGVGNTYICNSCTDSGNNTNWSFINGSSIQFALDSPAGNSHITNTNPTYRWSKATLTNNSAITKYELYIQPKDSQDNNIGTALYIDNIAPFVSDNKQYQYNPTYTLYDDGDYLNLTPTNYSLPLGRYNFRIVAHDSAGNIAENSYNFWVDSDIFKSSYSNTKMWFPLQINSISGSNQKGVISSFGLPTTSNNQTTLTVSSLTPTIKGIAFSNATITLTITDIKTKNTKTYTTKAVNSRFTLIPTINSSSYLNISVSLDGKYTQLKTLTLNSS